MPPVLERPPDEQGSWRARQTEWARRLRPPPSRAVAAVSAVAGVVALLYFEELARLKPVGGERLVLWPVVALGVWASSAHAVHVRTRKMHLVITLSEIPVLIGIVFLRPGPALAAVGVGLTAALIQRKRPPFKTIAS